MDLNKAKILLEKINSLYKSIRLDDGELAAIERDLMLSYLRQLYELFREGDGRGPEPEPRQAVRQNEDRASEPVAKEPQQKADGSREHRRQEAPSSSRRNYEPPRIIEIPDSIKELTAQVAASREKARDTEHTPPPAKKTPAAPKRPPAAPGDDQASILDQLLEQRSTNELSEKLSQRPIKDLYKAIAINDRLLFVNQLFGKDTRALERALDTFNGYASFEEAQKTLAELAEAYRWTEPGRLGTAREFVKLVRRRYR